MKFNALILIDMWPDSWAQSMGVPDHQMFVARVLEYVETFEFNHVLYSTSGTPVHPWILSAFPQAVSVCSIEDVQQILEPNSTVLVGGSAWQACLHHGPINFENLTTAAQLTVFSVPHICAHYYLRRDTVTHRDFEVDSLLDWLRVFDYWQVQRDAAHLGIKHD